MTIFAEKFIKGGSLECKNAELYGGVRFWNLNSKILDLYGNHTSYSSNAYKFDDGSIFYHCFNAGIKKAYKSIDEFCNDSDNAEYKRKKYFEG